MSVSVIFLYSKLVCALTCMFTVHVHSKPVCTFVVQVYTKPVYSTGVHITSLLYRCTH